MKKFFAMLLAAMMLLSCVSAMATTYDAGYVDPRNDTRTTTFTDALDVYGSYTDRYTVEDSTDATIGTELWLRVSAQGQIDVTVPLALVFATNIDGGEADEADNYKIINYSTADLKVTEIHFKKEANTPLLLKGEGTIGENDVDTFAGRLIVAGNTFEFFEDAEDDDYGHYIDTDSAYKADNQLFELESAYEGNNTHTKGTEGKETVITAEMETSRLSFVTQQVQDDPDTTDTDESNDITAENTKGVQLLTVVYTIAVDDNDYAAGNKTIDFTQSSTTLPDASTISDADNTNDNP